MLIVDISRVLTIQDQECRVRVRLSGAKHPAFFVFTYAIILSMSSRAETPSA